MGLKAGALTGLSLAAVLAGTGCKKSTSKPSSTQIHSVTKQLAAEAAAVGATVRIEQAAVDSDSTSRDEIRVRLPQGVSPSDAKAMTNLLQRLDRVATRNGLT